MGLTRLDPRTALQGGRPDKTGPTELRIRRGTWGKGRVGLPKLDPRKPGGGGGGNLRKKQRQHRQGQDRHHLPAPRQPNRQDE